MRRPARPSPSNAGPEAALVELPLIELLKSHGYAYLTPTALDALREDESEVILRPELETALVTLNGIAPEVARDLAARLISVGDNERWLGLLRGELSFKPPGVAQSAPVRLLDFDEPGRNRFVVTRQLRVLGRGVRKPDLVVFVNGLPLVVIECKSPLNPGQGTWDAVDQIRQYEAEIPRLFTTNLFNIRRCCPGPPGPRAAAGRAGATPGLASRRTSRAPWRRASTPCSSRRGCSTCSPTSSSSSATRTRAR
jgi:hypothetical protein